MADLVASADNLDEENVDETAASPLIELIELVTSQGGFIHPSTAFMQPAFEGGKADEGFGVFVDSAVAADTELIRVPLSVCISAQAVQAEPALQCVFNDNPGLLSYPDEVLALGLMYAMLHVEDTDKILEAAQLEHAPGKSDATASNSPSRLGSSRVGIWAKHVQTMPMTFNTTIFWSESEMQELKFNAVYHLTGMMRRQMEADFVNIHQPLARDYPQLLGGVTKELYVWALSVVYSRAIEVTRRRVDPSSNALTFVEDVRVIVPLLDMANHNPEPGVHPADTFHYDEESDTISLRSHRALSAMEECYAVYGVYPNAKLLYTYGFVVLNNPHRAIDLWTRVTPQVTAAEVKQALLQRFDFTREQTYDFKGTIRPGFVSPALLATIRVIQCADDEIPQVENAFYGRMISVRNEMASYESLLKLIIARMDVTKAQADKEELGRMLLNDVSKADRRLCALIVRVEERELLQETKALIESWQAKLQSEGAAYRPPDSRPAAEASAAAQQK